MNKPIQKILFGSPGTGKSFKIDKEIIPDKLNIYVDKTPENIIKTVFHPEYTYGDFIGKLMPITRSGKVEYNFYEGHFLRALAQAYKNIIKAHDKSGKRIENIEIENVVLIIDEINRGNSSAIFGSVFQLLDREDNGWSTYYISINEIAFIKILELIEVDISYDKKGQIDKLEKLDQELKFLNFDVINKTIKIPNNLSIIATMNTSDSSIYYMDSAFKRRWTWEFIDIDSNSVCADGIAFKNRDDWYDFISKLNLFIRHNHKFIRGIEDKQVGKYFINDQKIEKSSIQNKLMFFLWDNVFNRDKKPLINLLYSKDSQSSEKLITFGDFAKEVDLFIKKINDFKDV